MEQRRLNPGEKVRVMIVDDSTVMRRLIARAIASDPSIDVVGTASNGEIGLLRIPQFNPDVITLDIEMPDMDGLEMLRRLRREHPQIRVIMVSTLTQRGAAVTLEALSQGADDYVTKPSKDSFDESLQRLEQELVRKIRQFFPSAVTPVDRMASAAISTPSASCSGVLPKFSQTPQAVVIGVSTGGPVALQSILPQLPGDFPIPILVVQHMPPFFTRLLAERLDASSELRVEEATAGTVPEAGKVLIAPGDFHMRVGSRSGRIMLEVDQSPPENFCRPAVDVLFRSAAEVYGGRTLALILTGMGQDGLRGAETLRARGATIFAQDEATSVVWGMPGAVANAGLADVLLPLDRFVPEVLHAVGRAR